MFEKRSHDVMQNRRIYCLSSRILSGTPGNLWPRATISRNKVTMAANQNSNLVSLRKSLVVVLWILTFVRVINCANSTSFQSRSDIQAPVLNINLKNDRLLTPGYLFLTPYGVDLPGPYIFDTSGVGALPCSDFVTALTWLEPCMERGQSLEH